MKDLKQLAEDFKRVAQLAGVMVSDSDIDLDIWKAPHFPPTSLPSGKMAVYVFYVVTLPV